MAPWGSTDLDLYVYKRRERCGTSKEHGKRRKRNELKKLPSRSANNDGFVTPYKVPVTGPTESSEHTNHHVHVPHPFSASITYKNVDKFVASRIFSDGCRLPGIRKKYVMEKCRRKRRRKKHLKTHQKRKRKCRVSMFTESYDFSFLMPRPTF